MLRSPPRRPPPIADPRATRTPTRPSPAGGLRQLTTRRVIRQQRWRIVGVVAALVLVGTTVRALWAADAARHAWSSTTGVVVATRDLPAGEVLSLGDLAVVGLPNAVVPTGAVTDDPDTLVGTTVSRPILAGEAVASARLAPRGLGPTAALVPAGRRAVALPLGTAALTLTPGDRVDLVGVAGGPGTAAPATVVASDAEVIAVGDDAVTVAIERADITDVVAATALGIVTIVLVGP